MISISSSSTGRRPQLPAVPPHTCSTVEARRATEQHDLARHVAALAERQGARPVLRLPLHLEGLGQRGGIERAALHLLGRRVADHAQPVEERQHELRARPQSGERAPQHGGVMLERVVAAEQAEGPLAQTHGRVELPAEVERGGVGLHQLQLDPSALGRGAGLPEHAAGEVDPRHGVARPGQLHRVPAGAAADVEDRRPLGQLQELGEERDLTHAVGGEHLVHVLRREAVEELPPDVVGHGPSSSGGALFSQESGPRARRTPHSRARRASLPRAICLPPWRPDPHASVPGAPTTLPHWRASAPSSATRRRRPRWPSASGSSSPPITGSSSPRARTASCAASSTCTLASSSRRTPSPSSSPWWSQRRRRARASAPRSSPRRCAGRAPGASPQLWVRVSLWREATPRFYESLGFQLRKQQRVFELAL